MRWAALLVAAAGCSFSGGGNSGDGDGGNEVDARIVDGIEPDVTCPPNADLVACYRFDLDTRDSAGDHDATIQPGGTTAFVAGADGAALEIKGAVIRVRNSADFETDAITVEFWLGPNFTGGYVFDLDGRFSVRIYKGGVVRCLAQVGGQKKSVEAAVPLDQWSHIGCTLDPNPGMQIHVNQIGGAFDDTAKVLDPSNGVPAHIGSDSPGGGTGFTGVLDNMRVWRRGLESDQLCTECSSIADPNT